MELNSLGNNDDDINYEKIVGDLKEKNLIEIFNNVLNKNYCIDGLKEKDFLVILCTAEIDVRNLNVIKYLKRCDDFIKFDIVYEIYHKKLLNEKRLLFIIKNENDFKITDKLIKSLIVDDNGDNKLL